MDAVTLRGECSLRQALVDQLVDQVARNKALPRSDCPFSASERARSRSHCCARAGRSGRCPFYSQQTE
eukprot:12558053-Alexandrium_andersonii.AAC.1